MKGLICSIYRSNRGDSSNSGISSKVNQITVIDGEIAEIFEPTEDAPAVKLVRRVISGEEYIHAEPIGDIKNHYMFGGTYISTSDSRFRAICEYPIPLHDRVE